MAIAWVMLVMSGCGDGPPVYQAVTINGRTFQMELAVTVKQRMRGLSERDSLPADKGMLFVLPKPEVVSFVMRRCRFPIDIAFLDADGRVVAMHEMPLDPPGTPENKLKAYSSVKPAQFALEFNKGTLKELNLAIDQTLQLPLDHLKSLAR
jgi:uncharacterized membrane protein (UPF0127 family)